MHAVAALIDSYRTLVGVPVCVHDYTGTIAAYAGLANINHMNPVCIAVSGMTGKRCSDFDLTRLRARAQKNLDGFCKVCHAGLFECFVPLLKNGKPVGALFSGPFRIDGPLGDIVQDNARSRIPRTIVRRAPSIDSAAAFHHLALLRMLAHSIGSILADSVPASAGRAERIELYLRTHYRADIGIDDLASHLGLKPSRTRELIRTQYARTFPDLINDRRLSSAAEMLRYTDSSVERIAIDCGFSDPTYFFRCFKKRYGTTPAVYRRSGTQ